MYAHRDWMYRRIVDNELSNEFLEGVDAFIDFTVSNVRTVDPKGRIRCACAVCKNNRFLHPFDVAQHLHKKGFVSDYMNWTAHGEEFWGHTQVRMEVVEKNPYVNLVIDAVGPELRYDVDTNMHFDAEREFNEAPNDEANRFYKLLKDANETLWDTSERERCESHTILSAVLQLLNLKSEHTFSDTCFDSLCSLVKAMLPKSEKLPQSFYHAKKMINELGLDYVKIRKAAGGVNDPLQWKDHCPSGIREDYWSDMCDKWATEEYQQLPYVTAQYWPKLPDSSLHTSGSINFGSQKKKMEEEKGGPISYKELFHRTHKRKGSEEIVSQKAKEVVKLYEQEMVERHGDDPTQHPQFDASAWLPVASQPKRGRVFGFGTGMDAGGVISSSMESRSSASSYSFTQQSPAPPPPPPPQLPIDLHEHYCNSLESRLDSWFTMTLVPALHAMGVVLPPPHLPPPSSVRGSDHANEIGDETGDGNADIAAN